MSPVDPNRGTARRTVRFAALLGVLAVLGAGAVALGAAGPAAPTITSGPASPTSSTSATFTFTGTPSGGSIQCKLDAGAFATCTSPKSYAGLASGSHTFQAQAVDNKGKTSSPAVYAWVIDTTPPSVTSIIRAGASPTNASSVSWTVTFSEAVTGVDLGDFTLAKVGLASAALTGISGSGSVYGVSASTGSGDGTLGLNLVDNDSIKDAANNPLGPGNGSFTGQVYTLDRTGPATAPTINAGPSGLVGSTSASFSFTTSESGVAGFQCSLDAGAFAACTSPKSYSGLAQGSRTFQVRGVDSLGNPGPAATRSWTVDTVPPAVPVFTQTPPDPSTTATSTFNWTDSSSDVAGYQCSQESGAFVACGPPPITYAVGTTNNGEHQFAIRAIDAAGNISGAASYTWKVDKGSGQNFTIAGNATGLLYPGAPLTPIALTITNPNSVPIYVTQLTVTVTNNPNGCTASTNVVVQQSPVAPSSNEMLVPANAVNWPVPPAYRPKIRLAETGVSQDQCKSQTFTLSYAGQAHS